jgi:hypothetical protein
MVMASRIFYCTSKPTVFPVIEAMKMKRNNMLKLSQLLFVWLMLQINMVEASIPEPDNVLYGTITLDAELLTSMDSNQGVVLKYKSAEVARYMFGDDPSAGDRYLLKVSIDALNETTFTQGDILEVFFVLDEQMFAVAEFVIASRGTTTELNLVLSIDALSTETTPSETDTDGDGIPDRIEMANGLNPFDSADASLDYDDDGFSNLTEYLAGTDIQLDQQAPLITASAITTIQASGLFTQLSQVGAMAYDQKDGLLIPTSDSNGFYAPGSYEVLWTATDAAGNQATDIQTLKVNPLVNFYPDQLVAEGSDVSVTLELNGFAASYPVIVPFTVSGQAQGNNIDHNLAEGEVIITSGLIGSIEFSVVDDGVSGEDLESVIITMGTPINAVAGQQHVFVAQITENNLAPQLHIVSEQGAGPTTVMVKNQGDITLTAVVNEPNLADTHSFDWSLSDNTLVDTDGDITNATMVIDSDTLVAAVYQVVLKVSDSAGNIVYRSSLLQVLQQAPVLSDVDSDDDGVSDVIDGYLDLDRDGIAQYLDAIDKHYVLPGKLTISNQFLIETYPGLQLSLGKVARQLNAGSGFVNIADVKSMYSGLEQPYDTTMGSISIVIPQFSPIPEQSLYSQLNLTELSWSPFFIDSQNKLYSAPGAEGYCPAPDDSSYEIGLVAGSWCVMLRVVDGGLNDSDGEVNQQFAHLGGVQKLVAPPPAADNDEDGIPDELDLDDDGDGYSDLDEVAAGTDPLSPTSLPLDTDGDLISNVTDSDDDNDGVLDSDDAYPLDPSRSSDVTYVAKNDVDGDGKSDLLWRSLAKGWNFLWAMDGEHTKEARPINVVQDDGWLMAGQGDYDADGKSDIFWRNIRTGQNYIYLMEGFNIKARKVLNYVSAPQWELRGSGDFNGDGKGDVLWRRVDRGDTWFYMMNGLSIDSSQPSLWVIDLNYKVVAIGDIDGDGTDDVIWRNQLTGINYIWVMVKGQITQRYELNSINSDWTIAGSGDLDGDGTDDIILRNQVDGRNWVYLMEKGQIKISQLMNTVADINWQIANLGDYDGDGKMDLLWRNESAGRNIIHLMDGLFIKAKGVLTPVNDTWQVAH